MSKAEGSCSDDAKISAVVDRVCHDPVREQWSVRVTTKSTSAAAKAKMTATAP